jgi:hypothetical protein
VEAMQNNDKPTDESTRLGFLGIELFDNGTAIRGGILITDIDTKPYEFRITSPVRASFFQRALYGKTLEDYIHIELISIPLIKELREEVDLIIISSPPLLRIRPKTSIPVVLVAVEENLAGENSDKDNISNGKLLSITTHDEFPSEQQIAQSLLLSIMQKRDLLEPFERIKVALTEAHKQKVGEGTK